MADKILRMSDEFSKMTKSLYRPDKISKMADKNLKITKHCSKND
jgi:hypothetical protein